MRKQSSNLPIVMVCLLAIVAVAIVVGIVSKANSLGLTEAGRARKEADTKKANEKTAAAFQELADEARDRRELSAEAYDTKYGTRTERALEEISRKLDKADK